MHKFLVVAFVIVCAEALSSPVDIQAQVKSFGNTLHNDNSYSYFYDTTNGIAVQESGIGGKYASGTAAYVNPDGQVIQLQYTADENGFHPTGAHLPTPPPIPSYILRSLEYIRTHPQNLNYQN